MRDIEDEYESLILMVNNLKFYKVPQDEICGIIDQIDLVVERINCGDKL